MKKIFLIIFLLFGFFLLSPNKISASEGAFELSSTNRESYRCYVISLLMANGQYKLLVSCRDLLFPPADRIGNYYLWGTSNFDGETLKMGSLGIGKAEFSSKEPFTNLFITIEENDKTKDPTGSIVMKGSLQKISFLDDKSDNFKPTVIEQNDDIESSPSAQEKQTLSLKDKLILGIKRSSVIAGVALIGLIGLIVVITRVK